MNCPYCGAQLYRNRDGTWSCYCCDHYDIDRDDLEVD